MKSQKGKRVSARLNEEVAERLSKLVKAMNSNISDVIAEAILAYSHERVASHERPWKALERNGFIGCGEGSRDLSTRYKDYLNSSLSKKYSKSSK